MRRKYGRDHLLLRFRYQMAEAAGEEGGEGGGGTSEEQEQEFNAKDAITTLQGTLASLQQDIKTTKKYGGDISALKKMVGDISESLKARKASAEEEQEEEQTEEEPPRRGTPKPQKQPEKDDEKTGDTGAHSAIADLQKKMRETQALLKKATDDTAAERTLRIAAETKQRNLERDRSLLDQATLIGLADDVDPKHVLRYFGPDCEFDDEADQWFYTDGEDKISLADAVKKFLPKYMQKPKVKAGGSGGGTPGSNNGPSKASLKTNAITAGIEAQKMGGQRGSLARYEKLKRDYKEAGGTVEEIIDAVTSGMGA